MKHDSLPPAEQPSASANSVTDRSKEPRCPLDRGVNPVFLSAHDAALLEGEFYRKWARSKPGKAARLTYAGGQLARREADRMWSMFLDVGGRMEWFTGDAERAAMGAAA